MDTQPFHHSLHKACTLSSTNRPIAPSSGTVLRSARTDLYQYQFPIAVISGILLERARYGRYVKAVTLEKGCCCKGEYSENSVHKTQFSRALTFVFTLFRQIVPYLILGAAIGAFIYGFIPEELIVAAGRT